MKFRKRQHPDSEKSRKKDNIWYLLATILSAGQFAVISIFITRGMGIHSAGIFAFAYTMANLFSAIARYGVRNYQVIDIKEYHNWHEYAGARFVTTIFSLCCVLFYLNAGKENPGYGREKMAVIFLVTLLKMIDSFEDLFLGMAQQKNKLGAGSRIVLFRLCLTTVIYCVCGSFCKDLIHASAITLGCSLLISCALWKMTKKYFFLSESRIRKEHIGIILKDCFPLCVSSVMLIFLGNAPKYIIDLWGTAITQAYFSILMLPAFMVTLLNTAIYQPVVRELGRLWQDGETGQFKKKIIRQCLVIIVLELIIVAGGTLAGLPVLGSIYAVDLSGYHKEFCILLLAGGMSAISSFFTILITVVGCQRNVVAVYAAEMLVYVILGKAGIQYGIFGVAGLYLSANTLLSLLLALVFYLGMKKAEEEMHEKNIICR